MTRPTGRVFAGSVATGLLTGCGVGDSSVESQKTKAPSADMNGAPRITTGEKSPHRADPCGRAREVATEVVRTLKGSA